VKHYCYSEGTIKNIGPSLSFLGDDAVARNAKLRERDLEEAAREL
jgi:hypothetical protein